MHIANWPMVFGFVFRGTAHAAEMAKAGIANLADYRAKKAAAEEAPEER